MLVSLLVITLYTRFFTFSIITFSFWVKLLFLCLELVITSFIFLFGGNWNLLTQHSTSKFKLFSSFFITAINLWNLLKVKPIFFKEWRESEIVMLIINLSCEYTAAALRRKNIFSKNQKMALTFTSLSVLLVIATFWVNYCPFLGRWNWFHVCAVPSRHST